MTSVLIRDVPDEELELLRTTAAERGQSLQAYLLEALHDRTVHARRQVALGAIEARLEGQPAVSEPARQAVHDAIDATYADPPGRRAHDH